MSTMKHILANGIIPNCFKENREANCVAWIKDVNKAYSLINKKSSHHSNSRLAFINTKQIFITMPFEHEITNLIQKAHKSFKINKYKSFGSFSFSSHKFLLAKRNQP